MDRLSQNYRDNARLLSALLAAGESFDLIERRLSVGRDELTLFFVDGLVKDGLIQRVLQFFLGRDGLGSGREAAEAFSRSQVPHVNVEIASDVERLITAALSGVTVVLGSSFGDEAILIDARSYPARSTDEPQSDRVMQGSPTPPE